MAAKPSTSRQNESSEMDVQRDVADSSENLSLQRNPQLILLKHTLNADKVQLWNPPYTLENGERGEIPQELLSKYASVVKTSSEKVLEMMDILRRNAVKKLAARGKFKEKGIATLKLRVCAPNRESLVSRPESVEISLQQTGLELRNLVSDLCGVSCDRIKLIISGQLVHDDKDLISQNVKCNSQVMVIICPGKEVMKMEENLSDLQRSRNEAEILSSKVEDRPDDIPYLEIADQNGRPLKLPKEEKKALAFAMALNEKGRASMLKKDYSTALLLLLDADKEFRKCRSDILSSVDNFALVNLDIVWCYQQLRNIDELPDAEKRLNLCENCFKQSYGENLERLTVMKGSSGKELALFMRLHLLQGIVAFHMNKQELAKTFIKMAEAELKMVSIDDEALQQVMSLGYKDKEARLGLRASGGNVEGAVNHIENKKSEKKKIKKEIEKDRKKRKLSNKLGKTENGDSISVANYKSLVEMGYSREAALSCLRLTNNDINLALEYLEENCDPFVVTYDADVDQELLEQITGLGYNVQFAQEALRSSENDVFKALDLLDKYDGVLPPDLTSPVNSPALEKDATTKERLKQEKKILDDFRDILPEDHEDHLNLLLTEESDVLAEYLVLIENV